VGRLRRFPSDPSVADLAVTVSDDWHGRGPGRFSREHCSPAPGASARSRPSSVRTTRPRYGCWPGSAGCDRTASAAPATWSSRSALQLPPARTLPDQRRTGDPRRPSRRPGKAEK
jgi:hypothetical protein